MLHEIGRELEARLVSRGCPFKVIDRETTKPTAYRNVIVIEHDDDAGDSFSPPVSQSRNPKRRWMHSPAGKITIYAQSTRAGALEFEHRRLAWQVLDLVTVAMDEVIAERRNRWRPTDGRFVPIDDLQRSERQGGAKYELRFTIDRAVHVETWSREFLPEGTVTGIRSTTRVGLAHGEDAPDATACGD